MATNPGTFIDADRAADLARDNKIIFTEINLIQQAILDAVDQCTVDGGNFTTIVKDSTPFTFVSRVINVEVLTAGANYFPVVATATFFHPRPVDDGVGNDATANVIVVNGVVNAFVITNPGDNYDVVVARADLTGTGDGLATVLLTVSDGVIVAVTVISSGTLYLVGENVPVVHPGGTGAVLTISSVGGGGNLLGVSVDNGGTGYDPVLPSVVVNHPLGAGFSGLVQLDAFGLVMGVSIQNGGSGYNSLLPSIDVSDPGLLGLGAELRATVDTITGELLDVIIIDGGAHFPQDAFAVVTAAPTSSGAGATVGVSIAINTFGTDPRDYYLEIMNQGDKLTIKDQISFVVSHFTKLGYSIEAIVNPDTLSAIQWQLFW